MRQALAESEEWYRTIVQTANEGVWLVDEKAQTVYVNEPMARMLGTTSSEMFKRSVYDFIVPEDRASTQALLENNLKGSLEQFGSRFRRKDGSLLHALACTSPIRDAEGKIVGVLGMFTDLTEHERTEQALQKSESLHQTLMEAMPQFVWSLQPDGTLPYANRLCCDYSGFTVEEINASGWDVMVHPDDLPVMREKWAWGVEHGEAHETELRYRRADGTYRWFLNRVVPVKDAQGRILTWVGTAADIDERKRAEEERASRLEQEQAMRRELEAAKARLQAILDVLPVGVCIVDARGRMLQRNAAFDGIWGEEAPMVGAISEYRRYKGWWTGSGQRLASEDWALARALTREEVSVDEEIDIEAFNGQRKTILHAAVPLRDEEGVIIGGVSTLLDITERKHLEHRLREAEQEAAARASQLEAIFEVMTDALFVHDQSGKIVKLNAAARQYLPSGPEEFFSRPAHERLALFSPRDASGQLLPAEDWPITRILHGEVLSNGKTVDLMTRLAEGQEIWFNVSGAPIYDEQEHIIGGIAIYRDVTERKLLERRTRESLEALLEMAEALVSHTTRDNGEQAPLYETTKRLAELICTVLRCRTATIVELVPGTDQRQLVATFGFTVDQEQQLRDRIQEQTLSEALGDRELLSGLYTGGVLVIDLDQTPYLDRFLDPDMREALVVPMSLGDNLVGTITLSSGRASHEYTQDEIAVASHELRTPLTTIKGYVQLAKRHLARIMAQEEAKVREIRDQLGTIQGLLDRTERQVGVQSHLVNDLLDVSRLQTNRLELHIALCDLAEVVREAVENQRSITPTRTIRLQVDEPEVLGLADAERLGQVVNNYLSNALKYSEVDRPVDVRLQIDGSFARVSVRDQGPGLSPAEQERVWERFYRVEKPRVQSGSGVGLGLGLYICQMLISRHNGDVGVESKEGEGSTFWFTVPLAQ